MKSESGYLTRQEEINEEALKRLSVVLKEGGKLKKVADDIMVQAINIRPFVKKFLFLGSAQDGEISKKRNSVKFNTLGESVHVPFDYVFSKKDCYLTASTVSDDDYFDESLNTLVKGILAKKVNSTIPKRNSVILYLTPTVLTNDVVETDPILANLISKLTEPFGAELGFTKDTAIFKDSKAKDFESTVDFYVIQFINKEKGITFSLVIGTMMSGKRVTKLTLKLLGKNSILKTRKSVADKSVEEIEEYLKLADDIYGLIIVDCSTRVTEDCLGLLVELKKYFN